ncbi:MAG: CRISPR-associated endonuclease Cas1 [Betaproteobacteria bacterium RIFCSPLOWO2_12_FULL_62_13]|nr:MAG: CRISPR-associated endonuclease Cas1 [Betaproteobacteria bacterium RIFCSPLOWO2_12_FULL_62_13]
MATLVIDRSNIEVKSDGAALAVYEAGERRGSVPLKLLDRVVLQGTIRLDTGVLTRLAEAGVPTVLLGGRSSRRMATLLGPAHRDASVRLAQFQSALDPAWCAAWSRRLIFGKTRGQLKLLRAALAGRPDARKPLFDAIETIEAALQSIADAPNLPAASVRGIEGACAAAHFRGLAALFAESLGFNGRNRRPPRDPVNAALSLTYTLLHFDAVRASYAAGLDPLVGFYHRPAHGRESLACDFIEPLRPRADAWVWSMFRDRTLRAENFTLDKGACLLGKAGREAFYAGYESFAILPRRWLRRQCASLAGALREKGEPLLDETDQEGMEI